MKDSPKYAKHPAYALYTAYNKNRNKATNAAKSILFVFILGMLLLGIGNILTVPQSSVNEKTGMRDIHKYPDSYDICFIGRSTAICNISCQELYEEYGIAGVSAAVSGQTFPMTKYTLEEVFEYQSPQAIILDTRALFDPAYLEKQTFEDETSLHFSLDDIKTPSIKSAVLNTAQKMNPEIDIWDYYSKLYYSHDNWKNISAKNFLYYDTEAPDSMHGNTAYFNIADNVQNYYARSKPYSASEITRKAETYLSDIIKLCHERESDLMLMTNYVQFTKPQHNAVIRLARKYDIPYIDINEYLLKSGFDYSMDLHDAVHFNLSGSIKMTRLVGDYLQEHYDFTDKRKDKAYKRYEKQKDLFAKQKKFISDKQTLLSATSFYKYLSALNQLNLDENIIFLSVYGDAIKNLTEKERQLLSKLGLQTNFQGKAGGNYTALITKEGIQENFTFVKTSSLKGKTGTLSYELTSERIQSVQKSSILINEQPAMSINLGFNFVIYNTEFDSVTHSCFFNTTESVNPKQSRYKAITTNNIQHATEPNRWENAE